MVKKLPFSAPIQFTGRNSRTMNRPLCMIQGASRWKTMQISVGVNWNSRDETAGTGFSVPGSIATGDHA